MRKSDGSLHNKRRYDRYMAVYIEYIRGVGVSVHKCPGLMEADHGRMGRYSRPALCSTQFHRSSLSRAPASRVTASAVTPGNTENLNPFFLRSSQHKILVPVHRMPLIYLDTSYNIV